VLSWTVRRGRPKKGDTLSHFIPGALAKTDASKRQISSRAQALLDIPWEDIEERLKATALALRQQGKSQKEVAAIVGVHRRTIDEWESNPSTNVKIDISLLPDLRYTIPKDQKEVIERRLRRKESLTRQPICKRILIYRTCQVEPG